MINAGQKLRIDNFDTETKPILSTDTYSGKDEFNIHVVKKGNTLFGLAKRFNLSVQELKSLNNLDSNIIKIGQKLRVNNFETSDTSEKLLVYIVKKGDNLYRIAKEHRTTVKSIKELNGLNSNHLQIGQNFD